MQRSISFVSHASKHGLVRQNRIQKFVGKQLCAVVAALLLLSGCTNAELARLFATPIVAGNPNPNATVPLSTSDNRLLVLGTDGNLFTVNPDGTDRLPLTTDASRTRSYAQATWSPSGEKIGWTMVEQQGAELTSTLLTSRLDGSERTETATRFAPFYLYWSPDDSQLAYLSNWLNDEGQTIALHTVDLAASSAAPTLIETGQPLYFSWSPDSKQMLTHVANERAALVTLASGETTVLSAAAANFAAPQWSTTGDRLLFVTDSDSIPQLVLTDTAGDNAQLVTNLSQEDAISFSLNPQGSQLAYVETSEQIGFSTFGPLFVYTLSKGQFSQLSDGPVLAFAWSPNGEALFYLTAEAEGNRIWLRVNIWDGAKAQAYERFAPSPILLREYLPFADQYMQSVRFWSPDSNAVVYAGIGEDGRRGVWVQPRTSEAQLVTEGLFATWSPK